jgi:integrase/recombinase XerD
VLTPGDVQRLLVHVADHRHALRDKVLVLLSFKAGLRACEIAGLRWDMVLASDGTINDSIHLTGTITKGGRGRSLPMHAGLKTALRRLHRNVGKPASGAVIASERGGHMMPRSIVNWFAATYQALDLDGCSSHSGRRTFITAAARQVSRTGGSLRDVQELAGHRALTTTERYIEGDRAAQRRIIALL